jgi:hypothetical protein
MKRPDALWTRVILDLAAQRFRGAGDGLDLTHWKTPASIDPMQRAEYIKDV